MSDHRHLLQPLIIKMLHKAAYDERDVEKLLVLAKCVDLEICSCEGKPYREIDLNGHDVMTVCTECFGDCVIKLKP